MSRTYRISIVYNNAGGYKTVQQTIELNTSTDGLLCLVDALDASPNVGAIAVAHVYTVFGRPKDSKILTRHDLGIDDDFCKKLG